MSKPILPRNLFATIPPLFTSALILFLLAPSSTLATTNPAFVQKAYLDLLLRPASPTDLSTWVPPLDAATMTRTQFALNVMYGDEYRRVRANELYADFLSRLPTGTDAPIQNGRPRLSCPQSRCRGHANKDKSLRHIFATLLPLIHRT